MKYIMKKNNVERIADTELSKDRLEKLGYKIIKSEKAAEEPEAVEVSETVEEPEAVEVSETVEEPEAVEVSETVKVSEKQKKSVKKDNSKK